LVPFFRRNGNQRLRDFEIAVYNLFVQTEEPWIESYTVLKSDRFFFASCKSSASSKPVASNKYVLQIILNSFS